MKKKQLKPSTKHHTGIANDSLFSAYLTPFWRYVWSITLYRCKNSRAL